MIDTPHGDGAVDRRSRHEGPAKRGEGIRKDIIRPTRIWRAWLRSYEMCPMDDPAGNRCNEFFAQRKLAFPDSEVQPMTALDHLDAPARAAIRRVLTNPLFELIPLKNVLDQAKYLPDGAMVSVTASPAKGMDATLDLVEDLQQMGFDVMPHLSARLITDRAHLERILDRLDRLRITRVFVMGGDGDPSEFFDSLSLLMAMDEIGHDLTEIGIAAHPEGHTVLYRCFSPSSATKISA